MQVRRGGQRLRGSGARIRGRARGDQISKSFKVVSDLTRKTCEFFDFVNIFRVWSSEFLTGKVTKFSRKWPKNVKSLSEKFEIFCPGPAFGSATPGPASAVYAPGAMPDMQHYRNTVKLKSRPD